MAPERILFELYIQAWFCQDPTYTWVSKSQSACFFLSAATSEFSKQTVAQETMLRFIVMHRGCFCSSRLKQQSEHKLSLVNLAEPFEHWLNSSYGLQANLEALGAVHTPVPDQGRPLCFSLLLRIKHQNQMINWPPSTFTMLSDLFGV